MPSFEAAQCQHTKTNGTRCGSPALKDNLFCYYHQHCRTVVINYHHGSYSNCSESELTLPPFEDAHSIQSTLHKLVEFILQHRIEDKKARLVLYALQLASANLKRLERELPKPEEVVTEPPFDPVREFHDEQERIRQVNEAELRKMFPLDPSPVAPGTKDPKSPATKAVNDNLPPGTIHACANDHAATAASAVRPKVVPPKTKPGSSSSPAVVCGQRARQFAQAGEEARAQRLKARGAELDPTKSPALRRGFVSSSRFCAEGASAWTASP